MKIRLINKSIIAKDTLRVEFETETPIQFTAGQFSTVTLSDMKYPDPRGNTHTFSLVNSPKDANHYIITTRLRGSGYKKTLQDMEPGQTAEMGTIHGNFVLPESADTPLVFIAGGIGITPYMSMLTHVFENNLPYKITLIYSNSDQESTAYYEELKKMDEESDNFKAVFIMTKDDEWTGESRHIDPSLIKEYFPDFKKNKYYVVGPPAMAEAIDAVLLETGIEPKQILRENFGGY